jgi:hypothetical protein
MKHLGSVALIMFIASGCASSPPEVPEHARKVTVKPTIPRDESSCTARGGSWTQLGLPGSPAMTCDLMTSDAGHPCADSTECEGECLAQGIAGTCSSYVRELGCHAVYDHGNKTTLCRD